MATIDYKQKIKDYMNSSEVDTLYKSMLNNLFPELAESEDEQHRKWILEYLYDGLRKSDEQFKDQFKAAIAWLEKQGEQKSIDDLSPQEAMNIAVAKCFEQGEQKPAEWSIFDYRTWQYIVSDVLTKKEGIGQYLDDGTCKNIAKYMQEEWSKKLSVEQRTTELPKGQDYGIDGLYAAIDILTKTLGEVDGYQSDDGILEHKCAISAVKNLYEQEPAWSEEDENRVNRLIAYFEDKESFTAEDDIVYANWLKSLKDRVQPQPKQEWKQENTDDLTDFENAMMHIGGSFFGDNAGLDPNDTNAIKEQANLLLELVSSKEWSEEDEEMFNQTLKTACAYGTTKMIDWLKSLRPQKQNITNKDFEDIIREIKTRIAQCNGFNRKHSEEVFNLLDSLRLQNHYKPSKEQLDMLRKFIEYFDVGRNGKEVLISLYNDLKKLTE